MVYLYYISCLRYTSLVGNPRYIVEIHHSGKNPIEIFLLAVYSLLRESVFHSSHLGLCSRTNEEGKMANNLN